MTWVPDKTGRFAQRPHYSPQELDVECEKIISRFLRKRYGQVLYPITTEDLTILIEEKADFDSFADLSQEGSDVEGVTEFRPGKRPVVKIAAFLGEQTFKENRLRTTLTHEYGHVHFHQFLFDGSGQSLQLFPEPPKTRINRCHRHGMVDAPTADWLEWQAGYACGALLMPLTTMDQVVRDYCHAHRLTYGTIGATSDDGCGLVEKISTLFQTSKDAARVRLIKRGVVIDGADPGVKDLLS